LKKSTILQEEQKNAKYLAIFLTRDICGMYLFIKKIRKLKEIRGLEK